MLPIDGSNRKGCIHGEREVLDTREYDVIFPEGSVQSYLTNDIAERNYLQVDQEGHSYVMLSKIIDHEVDDSAIRDTKGVRICTTKGWHLIVAWKDGTTSSVTLREMKNSCATSIGH